MTTNASMRRMRGFTLVEAVVVIVISGIVFAAVAGCVNVTARAMVSAIVF